MPGNTAQVLDLVVVGAVRVASLLRANGVTVVDGHARLVGPTAVEVVAVGEAPADVGRGTDACDLMEG